MNESLRLFFAIDLTAEIRGELFTFTKQLRRETWGSQIRWTRPENLHITLRFIEACPMEKLDALKQQAQELIKDISAFTIQLDHVRLFPNAHHPRVVVLTIFPVPELFQLAAALEQACVNIGLPAETRPFLPHLTIGRCMHNFSPVTAPQQTPTEFSTLAVDRLVLFHSESTDEGQVYTPLHAFSCALPN